MIRLSPQPAPPSETSAFGNIPRFSSRRPSEAASQSFARLAAQPHNVLSLPKSPSKP
jgi:hypothetical protein